jgi:PPM family protein phosphatase
MKAIGRSDRGLVRESNQDQYAIIKEEDVVFAIVCDGIGGHVGGERASKTIINFIKRKFKDHPSFDSVEIIKEYVRLLIIDANKHLFALSQKEIEYRGMGTTLVALLLTENYSVLANVGDSRCYAVKPESMYLLSEDHSYVNELIKMGKLDPKQAKNHPYRNMLTNALGISDAISVDIFDIKDRYNDYLLCSDGLHGYVSNQMIHGVLTSKLSPTKKVNQLIQMANDAGGYDNVTIIYLSQTGGV